MSEIDTLNGLSVKSDTAIQLVFFVFPTCETKLLHLVHVSGLCFEGDLLCLSDMTSKLNRIAFEIWPGKVEHDIDKLLLANVVLGVFEGFFVVLLESGVKGDVELELLQWHLTQGE